MKKILIILLITSFVSNAKAQKSTFFVKGGINVTNITATKDKSSNILETGSLIGFHVGGMADLPLGKTVSLQPSLILTGKGAKLKGGGMYWSDPYEATTRPYYLELPLNIVFKFPASTKEANYFAGGGGYAALGVGGKNKAVGTVSAGMPFGINDKIRFNAKDVSSTSFASWAGIGYMKRLDYGLNVTAGFAFKNFIIAGSYEYGLSNINKYPINNDKNKHRVFSLSAGFGFL